MSETTIIYLTHNQLDPEIMTLCQRKLLEVAGEHPIISVSQTPINLGLNVPVGQIGINWRSIYVQLIAGLAVVKTPFVAIAEHDCLYTPEHFDHIPTDPEVFDYNRNCWLVQWKSTKPELDGMYSFWPKRIAQSQVICYRDSLLQAVSERLELVDAGLRGFRWAGEPGMMTPETWRSMQEHAKWATSGKPKSLYGLVEGHVKKWKHSIFTTTHPNLDIRHGANFTGPRRGKKRCWELPYWGKWSEVIGG